MKLTNFKIIYLSVFLFNFLNISSAQINITNPWEGATLTAGSTINITANVTVGSISEVTFWSDNDEKDWDWMGSKNTPPYQVAYGVKPGTDKIRARVTQYNGTSFYTDINVNTNNNGGGGAPIVITNPSEGTILTAGNTITVSADVNVGNVERVHFWSDNDEKDWDWMGSTTMPPHEVTYNVKPGTDKIRARFVQWNGATSNAVINVNTNNGGGGSGTPIVITNPSEGTTLIAGNTITVSADVNVGNVERVHFWSDNDEKNWDWMGSTTTPPHQVTYNVKPGTDKIRARVVQYGGAATDAAINVNTNNDGGGADVDLVTPDPTPETVALWEYMKRVPTEGKILAGIWDQGNHYTGTNGYTDIYNHTGKYAAIFGEDLWCWHLYGSQNCNNVQQRVINNSISHANNGGIVQINWHWGNPFSTNFNGQNAWVSTGGGLANWQWDQMLTSGTWANGVINNDIDRHVNDVLKNIKYADGTPIPILFRPLHEIDGGWFWWTNKDDPSKTIALWNYIYNRIVYHHGMRNLIWVWSNSEVAATTRDSHLYYPGDSKVDILGADIYDIDFKYSGIREDWSGALHSFRHFYDILQAISPSKPKALSESDALPNPTKIQDGTPEFDVPWVYALPWWSPADNYLGTCYHNPCHDSNWANTTYHHDLYITLDELPDNFARHVANGSTNTLSLSNYPNPFTGQSTIEFELPQDMSVTLYVSDMMGRQIEVLLDNELQLSGTNRLTFDADSYPTGMYYYTIEAGAYFGVQKMLITE